jgi:Ubiquitin-2 like Rad60 SUMO-like
MSEVDELPAVANKEETTAAVEHLNIKVTDGNNEVFFKIKRTTQLSKLMHAFCDKQGKSLASCRFLFDGQRVTPNETPQDVSLGENFAHGDGCCCLLASGCYSRPPAPLGFHG